MSHSLTFQLGTVGRPRTMLHPKIGDTRLITSLGRFIYIWRVRVRRFKADLVWKGEGDSGFFLHSKEITFIFLCSLPTIQTLYMWDFCPGFHHHRPAIRTRRHRGTPLCVAMKWIIKNRSLNQNLCGCI